MLLSGTPPMEHLLEFGPGGRECLDKLRTQSWARWTLVVLLYTRQRQRRYTLVDLRNIFVSDHTFLAVVGHTGVDIQRRWILVAHRET